MRLLILGCIWVVGLSCSQPVLGQGLTDVRREYNVKAVFLYSFGRYVDWPPAAFTGTSQQFVIGIVGDDPFENALNRIAAKRTISNRKIAIKKFDTIDEYQPCHIVFVSRGLSPEEQQRVTTQLAGHPVLLVGVTTGLPSEVEL